MAARDMTFASGGPLAIDADRRGWGPTARRGAPDQAMAAMLQTGLDHLQHERLALAECLFLRVEASNPDNLTSVLALGVIAWRQQRHEVALGYVRRAIKLSPRSAGNRALLARVLRDLGRSREAIAAFRAAIRIDPGDNVARCELAAMLTDMGDLRGAALCYRTSVRHDPGFAAGHYNLGNLLARLGEGSEAIPCYEVALGLQPGDPRYLNNLADALRRAGRLADAEALYRELADQVPEMVEAHYNLGIVLHQQDRFAEAAVALRRALVLDPDHAGADNTLGATLFELGEHGAAEVCIRRAIGRRPDLPEARNNLGSVLRELGQDSEAEASFLEALSLEPDHAAARYNLATTLLLTGRLREGWDLYEARWRTATMAPRGFVQPLWRQEAMRGQVLLLHAEQGMGDAVQFCRYVRSVAATNRVVLEVHRPLVGLLARSLPEVERVVARGDPLPTFHAQCPLMSLPMVLGTTLETIPGETPYLKPDAAGVARWRARLDALPGLRVGLVWRGNQRFAEMRRKRDLADGLLEGLATPGVSFVSLQKDLTPELLRQDLGGLAVHDWTDELDDFDETAALVSGLDLVIGVDTAVVHLAGALGRPVWLMNRFDTCWRWLRDRYDSPWYPSLRQFRQPSLRDWGGVIESVRSELVQLAHR